MESLKPTSYCSISILNDNNEITNTLDDCYFKYTYKWLKGGRSQVKLMSYLDSITLMQDDKETKDININKIIINDMYFYNENEERVSILEMVMDKYKQVYDLYGDKLEFPVSRIIKYID